MPLRFSDQPLSLGPLGGIGHGPPGPPQPRVRRRLQPAAAAFGSGEAEAAGGADAFCRMGASGSGENHV